jgi:hypothetical protein
MQLIRLTLLLVLAAAPVSATTVIPAQFADMVAGSELIVRGTVVDVRSQLTGGRRTIESLITLQVIEGLKGAPARQIVFRVPGGQVGRYRRIMPGAPEFVAGEEVIVFLSGQAPALPMPFGLNQGVYRVTRSDARVAVAQRVRAMMGSAR